MARVTVEDCVKRIKNRFDLVIKAANRTRQISQGAEITVDRDNDKNTVVSLREIAEGTIDIKSLRASLIRKYQRVPEIGSDDDIEVADLMKEEQAWISQPESSEMREEITDDQLKIISEKKMERDLKTEAFEDVSEKTTD